MKELEEMANDLESMTGKVGSSMNFDETIMMSKTKEAKIVKWYVNWICIQLQNIFGHTQIISINRRKNYKSYS